MKHLIYTEGLTLYGKPAPGSEPWADDAVVLTASGPLYTVPDATPYVFVRAGGAPLSTDTFIGDSREFYYGDVESGDLLHARRVHSWDWVNSPTLDKVKALYDATDIIDKFCFVGCKTDPEQAREFPRTRVNSQGATMAVGSEGVPSQILYAAYLIADALLGGRDPQADFESANVKVETFGPIRTEYATDVGLSRHTANLVPSPVAWAKIQPFLAISSSFRVEKG